MKQFNITLKRIAITTSVVVKSIPLRLYTAIKNKLILIQHDVDAALKKTAFLADNKVIMSSKNSGILKTIFEKARNELVLDSKATSVSEKMVGVGSNFIELSSKIDGCHLTRYRLIGEMDQEASNYHVLADFDDMTLEDLDYVTV